jgi:exopolysaccharide production protein ExoQ
MRAAALPGWERVFLVGAVLNQQDAFLNVVRVLRGQDGAIAPAPSDPLNFLLVALTLAGLCILIPRHRRTVIEVVKSNSVIVALCLLVMFSALWSVAPGLTAKRSIVHLNTALLALYLGSRLNFEEALHIVALAAFTGAAASLACALAVPSIGVMHTPGLYGKWRGVYTHKNELGQAIAVGMVAQAYMVAKGRALWVMSTDPERQQVRAARVTGAIVLAVQFLLVVRAASTTGLTVVSVSLAIYAILLTARRGGLPAKTLLAVAPLSIGGIAGVVVFFPGLLSRASGKDATLSGRTELWAGVLRAIYDRPWLGYGFQAFWSGADHHAVDIWTAINWVAPNAHNGYLEVTLGLGLVGLAAVVATVLQALIRAMRLLAHTDTFSAGSVALALTTAITVETFTEAVLVQQNDIDWFLLLLTSFAASRLILARPGPVTPSRDVRSRARPLAAVPAGA